MATQASDSWSVVDENNGYMRTWLALADTQTQDALEKAKRLLKVIHDMHRDRKLSKTALLTLNDPCAELLQALKRLGMVTEIATEQRASDAGGE